MITLYKPGCSHTVRGVQCELRRFDNKELEWAKAQGYKTRVEDLYEHVVEVTEETEELNEKQIRELAREQGVKNYWNRNIDTLKEELGLC